jgi:hypothetical protein
VVNKFPPRAVYEIMWKKYRTAGQATDDIIIRRMRFARWILKATNTHSDYVIIIAFPLQHWSRERTSLLRYTYIACIFIVVPCILIILKFFSPNECTLH